MTRSSMNVPISVISNVDNIPRRLQNAMNETGLLNSQDIDRVVEDIFDEEGEEMVADDAKEGSIPMRLVNQATTEEQKYINKWWYLRVVDRKEASGSKVIRTRWVVTNKGNALPVGFQFASADTVDKYNRRSRVAGGFNSQVTWRKCAMYSHPHSREQRVLRWNGNWLDCFSQLLRRGAGDGPSRHINTYNATHASSFCLQKALSSAQIWLRRGWNKGHGRPKSFATHKKRKCPLVIPQGPLAVPLFEDLELRLKLARFKPNDLCRNGITRVVCWDPSTLAMCAKSKDQNLRPAEPDAPMTTLRFVSTPVLLPP